MILLAFVLFLLGTVLLLFPRIEQARYARHALTMIADFEGRLEVYEKHGDLAQLRAEIQAYNAQLYESGQARFVDPFSYQQVDFSLRAFGFEEEMIGYVSIARMDVKLPIFLGASEANLARGVAHLTQTSLPVGGVNTNAVIAGHRGMRSAAMFRDIERLVPGDEILIVNFYETLRYRVVETRVILPTQVGEVLIQSGRDLLTLITCHPYRFNHQRYLVIAEWVDEMEVEKPPQS